MTLDAKDLWLIPVLPLAAAGVGLLAPRGERTLAAGAAILAMTGSLVLSILALAGALANPAAHQFFNFPWVGIGSSEVVLGWLLDPLAALMCVMVTFVGLLIFVFSTGYMKDDANFNRFFCFLSLFASAMLGLLLSNSLLLLFVCWELVGLASYLLIGFWFQRPAAAAAAKKAFITTRTGDLGLLLGMLWLYDSSGSLLFYDGGQGILEPTVLNALTAQTLTGGLAVSTAIGLLVFCGAAGKSGQFPLHVWLPDAMEGPTPVSALIHAATMVAAGVFLVARMYPLMAADQNLASVPLHALTVVAFVGAFTALLGAVIAVAQSDIKRVLAFSTVSQLGYMMLAVGVGSWVAAIFHLLTHAFFKALLFLCAGSVIHATHHEQDIRRMGGLSRRMRLTFATFAIGSMALSGVPFLFSGFWSKEAILRAANVWDTSPFPFWMGLAGVVLTAFYMTRLVAEVFLGTSRSESAAHAQEGPRAMTIPLIILAVGAVGLGFLGTPMRPWLQSTLLGRFVEPESLLTGASLTLFSVVLVALGIGAGWALYLRRPRATEAATDPLNVAAPRVFGLLAQRMKFDELYDATVGAAVRFASTLAEFCDKRGWDLLVRFGGRLGEFVGLAGRESDDDGLNQGFDAASETLRGAGKLYSQAQTGAAQDYLLTIVLAFVVLVLLVMVGGAR